METAMSDNTVRSCKNVGVRYSLEKKVSYSREMLTKKKKKSLIQQDLVSPIVQYLQKKERKSGSNSLPECFAFSYAKCPGTSFEKIACGL